MATDSIWPVVHAERAALASDLAGLDESQWQTRSLCEGWTVHEVLGHMVATTRITPVRFFAKLAGSGFRFERMSSGDIQREIAGGPAATLEAFRAQVTTTTRPPGPPDTMLGETIVHSEDIRRPLGIRHTYPSDALIRVANFYKGSGLLIGSKKRIAGLRLRADDLDWSTGDGPEVTGPLLSLLMATTGRKAALADLSGDGVPTLRSRM